jgi:transcriptional regulator with AAA-type ATPase domain
MATGGPRAARSLSGRKPRCVHRAVESRTHASRAPTVKQQHTPAQPPSNVDATLALLEQHDYVAERRLATAVFLALKLQRPLFLEGEAGVGKTEIAKVLAAGLATARAPAVL